MKFLLTGASGFLGRHILETLRQYEVITLGRKSGDILADVSDLKIDLPQVDIVIHAA